MALLPATVHSASLANLKMPPLNRWAGGSCAPFEVQVFPTLEEIIKKKGSIGFEGGEWTACTHLKVYGLNLATYFLRFLAFHIAPKTALEFGCGLGTTADYLARFVPGGSEVTCIEPEAMLGEVFNRHPTRPSQLAVNVFKDEGWPCAEELIQRQFDLVYSIEVAEHIPAEFHPKFVQLLSASVKPGGHLVFAAARPGQGGTGHIDESSRTREEWIELFSNSGYDLQEVLHLSRMARQSAYPERSYDLYANLFVMRKRPDAEARAEQHPDHFKPHPLVDRTNYPYKIESYNLKPSDAMVAKGVAPVKMVDTSATGGSDQFNAVRSRLKLKGDSREVGIGALRQRDLEDTLFPHLMRLYQKLKNKELQC